MLSQLVRLERRSVDDSEQLENSWKHLDGATENEGQDWVDPHGKVRQGAAPEASYHGQSRRKRLRNSSPPPGAKRTSN